MQTYPTEIKRVSTASLEICWSDGSKHTIDSKTLRLNCPCAVCKEKRGDTSHAKPLTSKKSLLKVVESSIDDEIRLDKIWQVGQYALGMLWGDGHQTGIYTFDFLKEIANKKGSSQ